MSCKFQSWTDRKDQNYEMELRNKKRIPVRRNKATKGKKSSSKSKSVVAKTKTADKSTQVQNICLEKTKDRVYQVMNTWLKSQPEFDPAENEKEAYMDLILGLYEELKLHIEADQLELLKIKQVELELNAVLTFTMASTYLAMSKFHGFARTFQSLSKSTVSLIFSLSSGIDLGKLASIAPPQWKNWNNVVDAINAAFKAQRRTIQNFEKMQNLVPESQHQILDKKLNITRKIKGLMDHFENAKEFEDFYDIDKKLLKKWTNEINYTDK